MTTQDKLRARAESIVEKWLREYDRGPICVGLVMQNLNTGMETALIDAIHAALLDASRVPEGHVRDDKGVDRKVLGMFTLTQDGYIAASMFTGVWCLHGKTGVPYETTPYHAGIKPMYATEEAALASRSGARL